VRPPPPIPAGADVGVIYHQWSKPGVIDALGSVANWGQPVELYKTYPGARIVALPEPRLEGGVPSARAIASRRSTRSYSGQPMRLDELSRFLARSVRDRPAADEEDGEQASGRAP
jgi:hypothetical protein